MAYGNRSCRKTFTKRQVGSMWWFLKNTPRGRSGRWKIDLTGRQVDIFEPNNTISGALSTDRRGLEQEHLLQLNVPQLHSFHKNIYGEMIDQQDWIPIGRPANGVLEDYVITVESTIANFIEDIEVFNAGEDRGLSIETQLLSRLVSSSVPNQTRWQISIPCDSINSPNRLYLRVRRNQNLNEFGTYTVLGTSNFSNPIITTPNNNTVFCSGYTPLYATLINTPTTDYGVRWFYHFEHDDGTRYPTTGSIRGGFGTSFMLQTFRDNATFVLHAEVTSVYTGCTIRSPERRFRLGKIPVANLQINHSEVEPNETCPNTLLRLSANLLEESGIDWEQVEEIQWTSSSPYFPIINNTGRAIQIRTSRQAFDYTTVTLRVRNACGWTEVSQNFRISNNTTHCIPHHGRIDMQPYPNPTKSDIKVIFKVDCQDCTKEELENLYPKIDENTIVTLNDAFGNIRLHYTGKQIPLDINKNIHLNLVSLPFGNYVLKVITKEDVVFAHIIKE